MCLQRMYSGTRNQMQSRVTLLSLVEVGDGIGGVLEVAASGPFDLYYVIRFLHHTTNGIIQE